MQSQSSRVQPQRFVPVPDAVRRPFDRLWRRDLPLVVSVGLLLSTFTFPLHSACLAPTSRLACVTLGAATALGGLLLQTIA